MFEKMPLRAASLSTFTSNSTISPRTSTSMLVIGLSESPANT